MTKEKKEEPTEEQQVEELFSSLEKEHGKGIISIGGRVSDIERISSGSIGLDDALGGGWARGRIIELYGPAGSGKTTAALHAIAEAQKIGLRVAFVDAEYALNATWASSLGVDLDAMAISQPTTAEEALNIIRKLCNSGLFGLIVLDSVAAMVPQVEEEGNIGDQKMGLQAKLMSQAMRILPGAASRTKTTVIFINQIRMKMSPYGNPEVTSGGEALKFYSSQRVDIRRREILKEGDKPVGVRTLFKIVKNKTAHPFAELELNIMFDGTGFDWALDLLHLARKKEIVERSGAWYSYKGNRIGQGAANASQYLRDNPEAVDQLKQDLGINE